MSAHAQKRTLALCLLFPSKRTLSCVKEQTVILKVYPPFWGRLEYRM